MNFVLGLIGSFALVVCVLCQIDDVDRDGVYSKVYGNLVVVSPDREYKYIFFKFGQWYPEPLGFQNL